MQVEGDVRDLLRTRLRAAMVSHDRVGVTALRSAISALDNAEAVEIVETEAESSPPAAGKYVAGAVVGLGAAEAARRVLSAAQQQVVLSREISDRRSAAAEYEQRGRAESAALLRDEASVLERALRPAR
ncbi:MAG TPA: hypothetical protein VIT42_15940 [Microlunatus sp.]